MSDLLVPSSIQRSAVGSPTNEPLVTSHVSHGHSILTSANILPQTREDDLQLLQNVHSSRSDAVAFVTVL